MQWVSADAPCRVLIGCDEPPRDPHSFPTRRSSDLHTFTANVGDVVHPVIREEAGEAIEARFNLYSPSGQLLNPNAQSCQSCLIGPLPAAGTCIISGHLGSLYEVGSYS